MFKLLLNGVNKLLYHLLEMLLVLFNTFVNWFDNVADDIYSLAAIENLIVDCQFLPFILLNLCLQLIFATKLQE